MVEFLKELVGLYKEKTKLPIISTYIIVLIIWNWDILSIYLFATPNMETKICWIKNMVKEGRDHWCRVLYPIVISVSYPIISHLLTVVIDWLMNPVKNKINKIKFLQRQESAKNLYSIEQERTGQKTLEQLRIEIETHKVKTDDLTKQLEDSTKRISELLEENRLNLDEAQKEHVNISNLNEIADIEIKELKEKLEISNKNINSQKKIINNLQEMYDKVSKSNSTTFQLGDLVSLPINETITIINTSFPQLQQAVTYLNSLDKLKREQASTILNVLSKQSDDILFSRDFIEKSRSIFENFIRMKIIENHINSRGESYYYLTEMGNKLIKSLNGKQ